MNRSNFIANCFRAYERTENNPPKWPFRNPNSTSYPQSILELSDDYVNTLNVISTGNIMDDYDEEAYKKSEDKVTFLSAVHEPERTIRHLAISMKDTLSIFSEGDLRRWAETMSGTLPKIIKQFLETRHEVSSYAESNVEDDDCEVSIREVDGPDGYVMTYWGGSLLAGSKLLKQRVKHVLYKFIVVDS